MPLPAELWHEVIPQLSTHDQRTCLFVSMTHHDVAIRSLFFHLHITFGAWSPHAGRGLAHDVQGHAYDQRKASERRNSRIRTEILQHVRLTPRFAAIVKKVSVLAYAVDARHDLARLEDVLTMLRGLRGFTWYGSNPPPPPSILERLKEASSQGPVDLILPSNVLLDSMRPCSLPRLTSLAFLQRQHPRRPTADDWTAAATASIHTLITTHASTLRALCVYGDLLLDIDVPTLFTHLTELSIINPRTLPDLNAIFEHCSVVRSFTLIDKARYDGQEGVTYEHWSNDELINAIRAHPHAFPRLTSLKLMGAWFWADQVEAVAAFLRGKVASLRRLDLVNDKWTRWDGDGIVDDWRPLFEILSEFPRLEVLGFDMRGAQLTAEDIQCLERCIPRWVTALAVTVFAESSKVRVEDWRRLITSFDSLRYLHILSVYGYERRDIEDILSTTPLPTLKLFGYNQNMRWVSNRNSAGTTTVELGERWPDVRVQFRTREDFGCEDWEWLLRHHGEDNEDVFWIWGK